MIKETPEQHTISYAYESSPAAVKAGRGKTGCWIYESANRYEGFSYHSDAVLLASELQTTPSRWSEDHPLNQHFAALQLTVRRAI